MSILKFLGDNPVLADLAIGFVVWGATLVANEALAALARKYPENATVAWITEQTHAYLGTLPRRLKELQERKDEVVR